MISKAQFTPIIFEMISKLFFPSSFPSLLCFLLVILVRIQSSSSEKSPACNVPFQCGSVTAGYPFWGAPQPQSCGAHQELQLSCNDDDHHLPTIEIKGVLYWVKSIDPKAQTVKISRKDFENGIRSPDYPNTTINFELFNYSEEYQNITFLYDCPSSPDHPVNFLCLGGDGVKYKAWSLLAGFNGPGACSASIVVPFPRKLNWTTMTNPSDLGQILKEGFELIWKVGGLPCENCTKPDGNCGANSGLACPHISARPAIPPSSGGGSFFHRRWKIFIGVAAAVAGIIIIITILLIGASRRKHTLDKLMVFKNKKAKNDRIVETFVRNFGSFAPKKYNYSDVKRMTKSFSNKLGQGGYGDVYKGMLPDGCLVAVKFLKESKGNGEEFMNEVASISRTSHVNIVTLLGFCYERKKHALIYEFMPNGSLDKFIYDEEPSGTNRNLPWKTMYQIAVGIARGLEYLHRGCNTRIVHLDIKPHNILLDEDFCPKISDFGLAKLCKKKESTISMLGARGTIGYIAPEIFCRNLGEVSHKSDIYSYGMMILEMVGGRKNINVSVSHTSEIYFPNWIYKQLEPSKDFEFHSVVTEEEKELVKKMVLVSLWCIQTIPLDRPSITRVVEMLEGGLEYLQVPPKPSFASQIRSPQHVYPVSSSSLSA